MVWKKVVSLIAIDLFPLYIVCHLHPFHSLVQPFFQRLHLILITSPNIILLVGIVIERSPTILILLSCMLQIMSISINIFNKILFMVIEVNETLTQF